ncbi:cytoplasmic-like malate dehydrogenase [Medicago truncatula]|uniref:malate dehydrogenase n=1 Tax=Medicago truncatula TaxID=3880 RepID=G7LBJ9_MEDTR|nr:cytoplasmic-like malate dehydrogenase [Medicago truncatula]
MEFQFLFYESNSEGVRVILLYLHFLRTWFWYMMIALLKSNVVNMEMFGLDIMDKTVLQKIVLVLVCTFLFWKIIRYMSDLLKVEKEPVTVLVTGAAGQIGYALVPMIARGMMLGPNQPVILHMLDIEPALEALKGVKMELIDAAFPLLRGVVATTDVVEACKDVNIAVMVGGFPRKEGMERKDVMSKNVSIYKTQASALEEHAAAYCKVLVIANPANTNALILKEFAPSIPEKNITCLTRLDHNRALGQISEKLNVDVSDVKNVIIWGNHSSTQYPDVNHATVATSNGKKHVRELVADDNWLNSEFITTVQQRGGAIIKARKLSSALSAASAACDHIHDWVLGTPKGTWVSMGVYSDGSYGIQPGLIYSFPVTCDKGEWNIVQGLKIDEFSREKMDKTAQELIEEKALANSCL